MDGRPRVGTEHGDGVAARVGYHQRSGDRVGGDIARGCAYRDSARFAAVSPSTTLIVPAPRFAT
jgi:hypothetical protein